MESCTRLAVASCGPSWAAGQSDHDLLEEFRKRLLRPRRQEAYEALRRGIERGELPEDLDLDLVLDTLYGAIYMRFLIRHDKLSENYVNEVCRMVLEGAAHQASPALTQGAKKNGRAAVLSGK